MATPPPSAPRKPLTDGQRAYEVRRAAKAGKTLEKHLAAKDKQSETALREKEKAAAVGKPARKPGLLRRLIDKAHQPLKPGTPVAAGRPAKAAAPIKPVRSGAAGQKPRKQGGK